ncbi:MAG: hypothetical protein AB8G05_06255 [Oligoflexales bacterium]
MNNLLIDSQEKEQIVKKYTNVLLRFHPNFRFCPNDENLLLFSPSNKQDWNQIYCKECGFKHCFECGNVHLRKEPCYNLADIAEDVFQAYQLIKYEDPSVEWKLCPNCCTPVEKLEGCDLIICGANKHIVHPEIRAGSGCGARINWASATNLDAISLSDFKERINLYKESKARKHIAGGCFNENNNSCLSKIGCNISCNITRKNVFISSWCLAFSGVTFFIVTNATIGGLIPLAGLALIPIGPFVPICYDMHHGNAD